VKITLDHIRSLVREQLFLLEPDDEAGCIQPPDSTDAWHPSDIVPREDAWSGGDNIDSPLDHSEFETGESNAGPHVVTGFSGEPDPLDDEPIEFSPDGDLYSLLSLLMEEDPPGEEDVDFSPGPDGLFNPVTDEIESPGEDNEVEREDIVIRIQKAMSDAGISGEKGMFSNINDVDEFEDLVRFIFQDVDIENRQLAGIAMSIAKDFLENPEDAASFSNFNL
jgi:hypothetical protein